MLAPGPRVRRAKGGEPDSALRFAASRPRKKAPDFSGAFLFHAAYARVLVKAGISVRRAAPHPV